MWILRAQSVLAFGAAGAIACALASGQAACSSSSSPGNSSGSSSGSGADSGGSSGGGSGSGSGGTGSDGGTPSITITSPMANAMVIPTGQSATVDVGFTLANFTLVMPGDPSCANGSDNCGHIHVLVDGAACTPDGEPYNNADATGSPATAILSSCPMVFGMHTISLELHHNDHTPVIVGGGSSAVSASVTITAVEAAEGGSD